jgi:putative redox protein
MKIKLTRLDGARFEASNADGNLATLDGPEIVGGQGLGVRPMEMVLMGLAGCAAVDILLILQKGRHQIDKLEVEVEGERADSVPAVFTQVFILFKASGSFKPEQLERAAALSLEKYCSVAHMLRPGVQIHHSTQIID